MRCMLAMSPWPEPNQYDQQDRLCVTSLPPHRGSMAMECMLAMPPWSEPSEAWLMVRPSRRSALCRGSSGSSSLPRKYSDSCWVGREGGTNGEQLIHRPHKAGWLRAAGAAGHQRCAQAAAQPTCTRDFECSAARTEARCSKWLEWSNTSSAARQMSMTAQGKQGRHEGKSAPGRAGSETWQ